MKRNLQALRTRTKTDVAFNSSLFNLKDNKDKNLAKPSLNSENQEKNTSSLFAIFNHEAKSEKSSFINDFTSKEKKIDNTSVNSTPSLFNSIKVENGSEKTSTPSLFNFIKVQAVILESDYFFSLSNMFAPIYQHQYLTYTI